VVKGFKILGEVPTCYPAGDPSVASGSRPRNTLRRHLSYLLTGWLSTTNTGEDHPIRIPGRRWGDTFTDPANFVHRVIIDEAHPTLSRPPTSREEQYRLKYQLYYSGKHRAKCHPLYANYSGKSSSKIEDVIPKSKSGEYWNRVSGMRF